jgi:hypothetical protein
MKTNRPLRRFIAGIAFPSLMLAVNVPAQNLFVAETGNGNIDEFTPSGAPSIFVSGLTGPGPLAFDGQGDLFDSDGGSGDINEFINNGGTLDSTPMVFASGLNNPEGLAFAPVPEPSTLVLVAIGTAAFLVRYRKN